MGISCNPKGMGDQFYPFYGSEGCTWSRFKLNLSWNERVYQVDPSLYKESKSEFKLNLYLWK